MAMVGLAVPRETAQILSEIDVPGRRETPDHFHITILNLGDDVPIETIGEMMAATYEVAQRTEPFSLYVDHVTCFPAGDDGYPVICPLNVTPLQELWRRLCNRFDEMGLQYSKKFKEFRPHVTLAYADEEVEKFLFPTIGWGAHELSLWGGNSGRSRVLIHLPLSLSKKVASRRLTAQDFAQLVQRDRLVRRFSGAHA